MEKISRQKGQCQRPIERWARTVLVENIPWYVFEENIRVCLSDHRIKPISVKFWLVYTRTKFKRFAEVKVFSEEDAQTIVRLFHRKREFGVKLRAYQKYFF